MKLTIAKNAGFCMGVRRAVEMVLEAPRRHQGPIFTYGPLIHNPQVLELLKEKGIAVLESIPAHGQGTVLIRAHGVPPEEKRRLQAAGFGVIDATCPRVIKVQSIIAKHARQGYAVIIVGDPDHPEVKGLLGFAGHRGRVVGSKGRLEALPAYDKAIVVAQTTQNLHFFFEVKDWAAEHFPHYRVFDTICDSTARRQSEVRRLSAEVDVLVVVGGYNSGNTRRLTEIARQTGIAVHHVETESELDPAMLNGADHIGITAGASTPNWIINKVYRGLEALAFRKKGQALHKALYTAQRTLLLTNIYVALGAGCLCFAGTMLQNITHLGHYWILPVLYVLSMHLLNHLTGGKADQYNDPERAAFYLRHRLSLSLLALMAGGVGLLAAYFIGPAAFGVLLVMSLLGLSYNLPILPGWLTGHRYRCIRDIPSSKAVLISMAWGIVTAILPAISALGTVTVATGIVFLLSAGMVFVRTAFFDVLDMQGDRIVGRETIPILLGEQRTLLLLKCILGALIVLLGAAAGLKLVGSLAIALMLCPVFLFLVLSLRQRGHMLPGTRLEFLVETLFILAGLIALLWNFLPAL